MAGVAERQHSPNGTPHSHRAPEIHVGNRWRLAQKLGGGSFGDIYLGEDIQGAGPNVAVKLEPVNAALPQLKYEAKFLKILASSSRKFTGVATFHHFATEGDFNVLVMDLLGPSLEELFTYCRRKLSIPTVLALADQMLARIEYVHTRNIIHRDIKPDNFLVGMNRNSVNQIFVIDFGLAKRYITAHGEHIPIRENKRLTGTARYASINTHLGVEQSRRDDLESLGYVLLYFLRGSLPWQGIKAEDKNDKYQKISDKKIATSLDSLCRGFPSCFSQYLEYCRNLHFTDVPDYSYCRRLFRTAFVQAVPHEESFLFDWAIKSLSGRVSPSPSISPMPAARAPPMLANNDHGADHAPHEERPSAGPRLTKDMAHAPNAAAAFGGYNKWVGSTHLSQLSHLPVGRTPAGHPGGTDMSWTFASTGGHRSLQGSAIFR
eukprot:GABV01000197.1.p1 GENE.GABV01000197.1~~GABV01000197.1.p1  ORF type:complete len:433 (-),score=140.04 GABV01000197.1:58-1356(-)